jgi:hypothetical protein
MATEAGRSEPAATGRPSCVENPVNVGQQKTGSFWPVH